MGNAEEIAALERLRNGHEVDAEVYDAKFEQMGDPGDKARAAKARNAVALVQLQIDHLKRAAVMT